MYAQLMYLQYAAPKSLYLTILATSSVRTCSSEPEDISFKSYDLAQGIRPDGNYCGAQVKLRVNNLVGIPRQLNLPPGSPHANIIFLFVVMVQHDGDQRSMGKRIVEQSLDERRLLRPCGKKGVYACRKIDLGITVSIMHYKNHYLIHHDNSMESIYKVKHQFKSCS